MTQYVAYNGPHSATTALVVPVSYAAGAKCALQIGIPSGQFIYLVGFGVSFDEDPTAAAAANGAAIEIASTATASTMSTAHTTTTVKQWNAVVDGRASSMTMGTGSTGYGNGAITSNTTLRYADRRFIPATSSFDMIWPSDMRPQFGAAAAAEYVQLRVNTTITLNMHAYIIFEEL